MTLAASLPALTVAVPLAVAGLLLAASRALPPRTPDAIAILVCLAATASCAAMVGASAHAPLVTWFGGWTPRHTPDGHVLVLGISFVVDRASAAIACFIALLFTATLIFAWGYFDDVHAHFHVLMLLFLAGMLGFCLTHDLFDLFVWFEVMSVSAFALTGYALRTDALEGALNFTVVNTVGSYLILAGIGLAYIRLGALDFAALARGVGSDPHDPVVTTSFALLAAGLLIKAAQVPFQFWLADAHGVAPSPVSVIFSGAMVPIGLYGVARLFWAVYAPSQEVAWVTSHLLLAMGVASTLVGGVMSLLQRHIKRMLAFSTVSHVGTMVVAFALLSREGLAGTLLLIVGQGLVKAALFMIAGIILALLGGIDEIGLRGFGRPIWPVGLLMAFGGLLLAGLPLGAMGEGTARLDAAARAAGEGWLVPLCCFGAACTGAAVLRAAGRVFAGWGPTPSEEDASPTDQDEERSRRTLSLMLVPTSALLLLAIVGGAAAGDFASSAAARFLHPDTNAILGVGAVADVASPSGSPPGTLAPWIAVAGAVLLAALQLGRHSFPRGLVGVVDATLNPVFGALRALQSGLVGDYLAWLAVGLALFAGAFALS